MRILSRYFVGSYLRYYAAVLVVSLLIVALVDMMVNFDDAIEFGEGLSGAAAYLFLRVPSYYLPYLVPVGSYAAAFLSLGLPARSLEILAAKAGGIPPHRLALPVLGASLLLSGLALGVNETIVRETANAFDRAERGSEGRLHPARGAFWYRRGDTLFRVQEADRRRGTLHAVSLFERDARGRLVRSVHAETARIEDEGGWRLQDAVIRRFDAGDPATAPRTEILAETRLDAGSASDPALLDADPRGLSLPHLFEFIEALEAEGQDAARYRAILHARLAEPLGVLVFALLGAPLGVAVERSRSLAVAGLEGVGWLAAYYAVHTVATLFAAETGAAARVTPWLVPAAFGAVGLWRMRRLAA